MGSNTERGRRMDEFLGVIPEGKGKVWNLGDLCTFSGIKSGGRLCQFVITKTGDPTALFPPLERFVVNGIQIGKQRHSKPRFARRVKG